VLPFSWQSSDRLRSELCRRWPEAWALIDADSDSAFDQAFDLFPACEPTAFALGAVLEKAKEICDGMEASDEF
jgi:hypothetical protein